MKRKTVKKKSPELPLKKGKRPRTLLKLEVQNKWPKRSAQVAKELGLHPTRLSQLCGGDSPRLKEVLIITKYFKKNEADLFSKII